ncbi:50S ribosomal protein L29 [Candidatus Bathyarchaeota archaeon]|nr:50S ribosomal protein L29 [Candidatus Bathyarchaeota archaeon]
MPILRVKEIRGMPHEERMKRLDEFRTELLRLKTMIRAGGTVEHPSRIKELRRTVARILTIENEPKPAQKKKQKTTTKKAEAKPKSKKAKATAKVKEKKEK